MAIRVAMAALSKRIFAGHPTKNGQGFKEPRYDVTSDVLLAVSQFVGIDHKTTVECEGKPAFIIQVRSISDKPNKAKFDNDAAVQVAEEAFRAGFVAGMTYQINDMRDEDESWNNFEPSEAVKDLLDD